jgi:hypothetical protein
MYFIFPGKIDSGHCDRKGNEAKLPNSDSYKAPILRASTRRHRAPIFHDKHWALSLPAVSAAPGVEIHLVSGDFFSHNQPRARSRCADKATIACVRPCEKQQSRMILAFNRRAN